MIKILLIDHSLDSDHSVRRLLAALPADQFQVNRCSGYREILEGFRTQTANICVIDSGAGNGLRLLGHARSLGLTAPIVLVTADDASEVVAAIRNGAADCLVRDQLTTASLEHTICCVVEQARNAAQQAQRERRYLALFDSLEQIIYTHDLEGRITSMNPNGLHILGYSLPEILGMEICAILEPASKAQFSLTMNLLLDAQTQTTNEAHLVTRCGDSVAVRMNAHPIYKQGEPVEVQVLASLIAEPGALEQNPPIHPRHSAAAANSYQPPALGTHQPSARQC